MRTIALWQNERRIIFGLLGFLNVSNAGSTVFNWLMQIAGLAGFITWTSLNICHLAFMRALKARGISRDILPYKALWQPYFSYYGLFFNEIGRASCRERVCLYV